MILQTILLAILPLLFLQHISAARKKDGERPVVIIRLDDVQAWYCDKLTQTVVDTVTGMNTSISVGLIGEYLDTDEAIDNYLVSMSKNPLVEVVSHSYSHVPYGGESLEWQESDLKSASDMINKVTNMSPKSFIPPENSYDENTRTALTENSMNLMSAQCTWNLDYPNSPLTCNEGSQVVAPDIMWNGIAMLPAGAVLGGMQYWEDFTQPASLDDAVAWANSQIDNQGFCVLMLHPQEFATDESTCDTVIDDKIQVLVDFINYGKDKWNFMTFQGASSYYQSMN
jgi:hypothetical protein